MKILLLHLSDFHIKYSKSVLIKKIEEAVNALNVVDQFDECIVIFSGDLAASGKANEYKTAKYVFSNLLPSIGKKINKFVPLLIVPGNHDVDFTKLTRDGKEIQSYHDESIIDSKLNPEIDSLNNFFSFVRMRNLYRHNNFLDRRIITFGDYKIQFNLLNTACFSTLSPDDKELHFFPSEKLSHLHRASKDINLVISVMHHSPECFHWKYSKALENAIYDSSSMLFLGHEHYLQTKDVCINNHNGLVVPCGGEFDIIDLQHKDEFSAFVIDTDSNSVDSYSFEWEASKSIFMHKRVLGNNRLCFPGWITPKENFIDNLKVDLKNNIPGDDFTQYFVFPQLSCAKEDGYTDEQKILEESDFFSELYKKRHIIVKGLENAGKTTLLKSLYISSCKRKKIPLFYDVLDHSQNKDPKKIIESIFKEQYGEDATLYEQFLHLDASEKILLVDNFDSIKKDVARKKLLATFKEKFGCIVIVTAYMGGCDVLAEIKDQLSNQEEFLFLKLSPFYQKKRHLLIQKVCEVSSALNTEDIDKVSKIIDNLVHNENYYFERTPDFIIQYTKYFIAEADFDAPKGDTVFSKVFEANINNAIITQAANDSDLVITALEEIAHYMHFNKLSKIDQTSFENVINGYNEDYNVKANAARILDVVKKAKILVGIPDSFDVKFSNVNCLAYFVARSLFRRFQSDGNFSGIEHILKNICFGINDNIVLFISYIASNTKIIMSIFQEAKTILQQWEEVSFDTNNISYLSRPLVDESTVSPPHPDEKQKVDEVSNSLEEDRIPEDESLVITGIYDYNEDDIERYYYKVIRAIKYTEMIAKAIPAFSSTLKASQKSELIKGIYEFPNQILYAFFKPIENEYEDCVQELLNFAIRENATDKKGNAYTEESMQALLKTKSIWFMLNLYNEIAYLSSSKKTIDMISSAGVSSTNHKIFNLMCIENYGDTDAFTKEAEALDTETKMLHVNNMIRQIVRKHLIWAPSIDYKQQARLTQKFFPNVNDKSILIERSKERDA